MQSNREKNTSPAKTDQRGSPGAGLFYYVEMKPGWRS